MKFVASYSGGKDSALALHRMIRAGNEPIGLLTTCDEARDRSWFHHIPSAVLEKIALALGIPLTLVHTEGENYARDFERALVDFKNQGAEACAFGDIDIQEHIDWCDARCVNAGLLSVFPLRGENRRDLVCEFVDSGFEAVITQIDTSRMDGSHLGKTLTRELIARMDAEGTDVCGEGGEYHSLTLNGGIFKEKICVEFGAVERSGSTIRLPILG